MAILFADDPFFKKIDKLLLINQLCTYMVICFDGVVIRSSYISMPYYYI